MPKVWGAQREQTAKRQHTQVNTRCCHAPVTPHAKALHPEVTSANLEIDNQCKAQLTPQSTPCLESPVHLSWWQSVCTAYDRGQ